MLYVPMRQGDCGPSVNPLFFNPASLEFCVPCFSNPLDSSEKGVGIIIWLVELVWKAAVQYLELSPSLPNVDGVARKKLLNFL